MLWLHLILIFVIWAVLWWYITDRVTDKYKIPWPYPDKIPSPFDKFMYGMAWFHARPLKWPGWSITLNCLFWMFANIGLLLVILFAYLYRIGW